MTIEQFRAEIEALVDGRVLYSRAAHSLNGKPFLIITQDMAQDSASDALGFHIRTVRDCLVEGDAYLIWRDEPAMVGTHMACRLAFEPMDAGELARVKSVMEPGQLEEMTEYGEQMWADLAA